MRTRLGKRIKSRINKRKQKRKERPKMKERMIKFAAGYLLKYGIKYIGEFSEELEILVKKDGFQRSDLKEAAKKAFKDTFGLK